MKTKLLTMHRLSDGYLKDLSNYKSLTKDQINTITKWLSKLDPKIGIEFPEESISEISKETGLTGYKLNIIFGTLAYTCTALFRHKDNANDFVDDLISPS